MAGTTATAEAPEYVRLSEVARRLSVSPSTVRAAVEAGQLRGIRVGARGVWRIQRASLERLLEGEEETG